MSNCCDSPTHIFDEHHPFAVSYMQCGLAGKESNTAAELHDHGAQGSESSRSKRGGGEFAQKLAH
eukprot:5342175-Pleurochrysis_carterae.AAC.1